MSSSTITSRTPRPRSHAGSGSSRARAPPEPVKVLQFYPSQDLTKVTCLWESDSVESVQDWVDATLGDSSENLCYPVAADQAFAERPLGLPATPMLNA